MFSTKDVIVQENIKPDRVKYKNEYYKILEIPSIYTIKQYVIKTINNKLDMIILKTPHPNCNPQTYEFCIPHIYRNIEYNQICKGFIRLILSCYNFDDCYFTVWNEIKICNHEGKIYNGK